MVGHVLQGLNVLNNIVWHVIGWLVAAMCVPSWSHLLERPTLPTAWRGFQRGALCWLMGMIIVTLY